MSAIPVPGFIVRYATAVAQPVRTRVPAGTGVREVQARLSALEATCLQWLVAHSISVLRVSIGSILLGFGVLKFFPA